MKKPVSLMQLIMIDLFKVNWLLVLLVVFVCSSAIGVTLSSQQNRELNAQLARLTAQKKSLEIEWRKLRLEQRALSEHSRIEQLAKQKLNMVPVTAKREYVIQ